MFSISNSGKQNSLYLRMLFADYNPSVLAIQKIKLSYSDTSLLHVVFTSKTVSKTQ